MQKSFKKGQVITSLLVLQSIVETDRRLAKETGKSVSKAKFKYALNMNTVKLLENAKVINDVYTEKFVDFKNDYNTMYDKYKVLDDAGQPKNKGNLPMFGLDTLQVPAIDVSLEQTFVDEYQALRDSHKDTFEDFGKLLEEDTSVDISEVSSDDLPDYIEYADIDVIKFMIKA